MVFVGLLSIGLALAASVIAFVLTKLIAFVTNLAFFSQVSTATRSPADNHRGLWVLIIPVLGGLIVGVMARYGSKAIRGHGIPEAMEQVLFNQSRIPARMAVLKPLSAAIAIGTGGPFGSEGPIIATGGALGSLVGQIVTVTADERKTLLAAGAVAGMAATFGTPVAAVLLAIELLLFEFRPRSAIPVALAAATATAARYATSGSAPVFAFPELAQPSGGAIAAYVVLGGIVGVISIAVTKSVYFVEDLFEKLPIHWMWWPALGGLAVGAMGYFSPHTLGVGYENIDAILAGDLAGRAVLVFCVAKFVSWSLSLGSGTSGGTLAPLFTLGGAAGSLLGSAIIALAPGLGVDIRLAALVGMAAMFTGASRALLASVVFAFETTRQPIGLLPLLGGCAASYLTASLLMENSIMTEKIARRGARVLAEYGADFLDRVLVRTRATREVVSISADQSLADARAWIRNQRGQGHTGFPVVDSAGTLLGVLTRRDLLADPTRDGLVRDLVTRAPIVVYEDESLREAADRIVMEDIGRLVVVARKEPARMTGILTRSDILSAHESRLAEAHERAPVLRFSRARSS